MRKNMLIVNIQVELLIITRCHSEGVEVRDGGTASSPLLDGDLPYCNDKPDTKGPSINDVTQIFGVFGPLSPFVTHSRNLSVLFVTLCETPLPPRV